MKKKLWIIGGGIGVVLFLLVIIAALAGLMPGRLSANETSVINSLKKMQYAEMLWWAQDCDNNGRADKWTYDVSCLYRAFRSDNETKVALIPLDLAMADTKRAKSDVFGNKGFRIADLPGAVPIPYNGYYFQMMESDRNGKPYNQWEVNGILATNGEGGEEGGRFGGVYAIVAYPAIYGTTGVNTYIINQKGVIYSNDCSSDAKKIVLQWPGSNPVEMVGPSGRKWIVAD